VAGIALAGGVPAASAATIAGNVGYGEMLKTPGSGTIFVGPLAASASDAKKLGVPADSLFLCTQWDKMNVPGVNATSITTTSTAAAATLNYIYQSSVGDKNKHSLMAIAAHQLLDPGRTSTAKGKWGYEVKHATGAFKTRINQANEMIKAAQDRRGPYKLAPAVTLSSDKKSITLTETYIKTAVGKNLATFNSKAVQVTATITGNATFSNGKKSLTFSAGAKQTLKVTGTGKVSVALKSAKVLPAGSMKQLSYSGKSQNKIGVGGLMAATGSKALTVPVPVIPDMGTTARTLIDGKADDDKQLDYVYGDPSWTAPRWVAPEQVPGTERQGDLTGLTTTGQDGTTTFDVSKAETVDAGKGIYKDAAGNLVNKDGYLVDPEGNLVLETRQGYFERTGTSAVTAQVDDLAEYGKDKPATDYIGTTGTLRTTIRDPKILEKDAVTGKMEPKNVTKELTGKDYLDFAGRKITAKRGTWNTDVITVNLGERKLTQRFVPEDQSGNGAPDWAAETVTTDTDDSKVTTKTTWMFFEDYLVGGKVLFSHRDPKSVPQSFSASNPIMDSVAVDAADGDKELPFSGGLAKDTVSASGLSVDALAKAGAKFELGTSFFDHFAGAENTAITATKAVEVLDQKKNTWSGELNIPEGFEGRELTFHARLWAIMPDGTRILLIDHTDKDAASQTITVAERPTGHTLAVDAADGDHYLTEDGGEVDETLTYTGGWDPKEKYTFVLQGVQPGTGKELPSVKLTAPFTPDVKGGQAKFKVQVPSRAKLGADGVAFDEKVIDSKGNVVFSNKNKDNPSETVYLPKIGTVATNTADGSKEFGPEGGPLTDTLSVEGHAAGTYYVDGVLAKKIGGQCTVLPNSKVKGEYTVAKDGQAGTGTVTLQVPKNTGEKDITYVVFEYSFKDKDRKVPQATHADCNSKEQAVVVKAPKPVTPPATTPPATPSTPPAPPLAHTGANPGLLAAGGVGAALAAGGIGALVYRQVKRRREDALTVAATEGQEHYEA
jgi:hypothetical protein